MNPDELLSHLEFEVIRLTRSETRVRIDFSQSSPVRVLSFGDTHLGLKVDSPTYSVIDLVTIDTLLISFNMEKEYLPLLQRALNFAKTIVPDFNYDAVMALLDRAIERELREIDESW